MRPAGKSCPIGCQAGKNGRREGGREGDRKISLLSYELWVE